MCGCAFIEIKSPLKVSKALNKIKSFLAAPQATFTHHLCSQNYLLTS